MRENSDSRQSDFSIGMGIVTAARDNSYRAWMAVKVADWYWRRDNNFNNGTLAGN